mgnify:CR=1 FL=1
MVKFTFGSLVIQSFGTIRPRRPIPQASTNPTNPRLILMAELARRVGMNGSEKVIRTPRKQEIRVKRQVVSQLKA